MNPMKLTLTAIFAVAIAVSAAVPAMAKQYYNPDTNSWEERVITPHGHGHFSPILRETVSYDTKLKPGTIVVETEERRLYFVLPGGEAVKYGIGVGRDGFRWSGQHTITRKAEWPGWTPPAEMRRRVPDLPAYMPGGPDNPLGARALYIGATLYRLHGTSEPWTIGQAVSSGCIRLTNEDIIDLFDRVKVGSMVVVHQ
jgi:lipoprotein-anchoring transpeptidase ErfK/SrfK